MVLRRNLAPFGVDLCWDGKRVYLDHKNGQEMDDLGEAYGPRTANEIMEEVESNLHEICNAMTL